MFTIAVKLMAPEDDMIAVIKTDVHREFRENLLSLSFENLIVLEGLLWILSFLIFGWAYKGRERN
jgi:uncharacterized protein involved in response to NO